MQINCVIDDNVLKNLMFYTHTKNESEALSKAVEDYLQWQKQKSKRDLLALRGKVDKWLNINFQANVETQNLASLRL